MRYAGLIENDIVNGQGVCVSLWFQGCPHRCPGCHNPESWDFEGGQSIDREVLINKIISAIGANGIQRNFSLLGGEPFCDRNIEDAYYITKAVKEKYPTVIVYGWSGSWLHELTAKQNPYYQKLLGLVDYLIAGPFDLAARDVTLPLRGSRNQIIHNLREKE